MEERQQDRPFEKSATSCISAAAMMTASKPCLRIADARTADLDREQLVAEGVAPHPSPL